ncbi:MAG: hypothetical protein F4X18_07660 [Acidimicrobiia bacterium]|nr:hypothetical protein [Acidimicrobiia bacterium]MYC85381.1 hypothetical protein [Acidimicrobiia bacterium]
MIFFVRFPPHADLSAEAIEEIVQSCLGRSGSVIGASEGAIDVELSDENPAAALAVLAAELRAAGVPSSTIIDIPSRGLRLGIHEV